MPIFEYACRECSHRFETLVMRPADDAPQCPSCQSGEVEKQLSVFSVGNKTGPRASEPAMGSCGSCGDPRGPGSCSLN